MALITVAYTAPVNPAEASPLTLAQLWAGLERKTRHGEEFVPGIESCETVEEKVHPEKDGVTVVVRLAQFKGSDTKVREDCWTYPENKVVFYQTDGTVIVNQISEGENGEMYLTYSFEWLKPEVAKDDAAQIAEMKKKYTAMAKQAIDMTLKTCREMVGDGRIKT